MWLVNAARLRMWASMRSDCRKGRLFVVGPHAQHPNSFFVREDLIDEVALDVDAPRTGAGQVADQLFAGRRVLERIDRQDGEKRLCFCLESSRCQLLRILLRVPGKDKLPAHQSSSVALASKGSAMASLMDSRMPGTDSR